VVLFLTGKSTESTSRLPPIVYSILQKNNSNNNTDSVLISAMSVTDMDRLDKSDAKFVDIIHTAGYWVGSSRAGGHVDIWPNGGLAPQPGCRNQESLDLSCSHFHAWKLFAESILLTKNKMPPLVGVKCENLQAFSSGACCFNNSVLVEIGDRINQSTRGNIFLKTKATYSGDYVLPPAQATNCDQLYNS